MGEGFLSQTIFTPLFTPPLIHQGIDGGGGAVEYLYSADAIQGSPVAELSGLHMHQGT